MRRVFSENPENQMVGFNNRRHAAGSSSGACEPLRRLRLLRYKAVVLGPFGGVLMRSPCFGADGKGLARGRGAG